ARAVVAGVAERDPALAATAPAGQQALAVEGRGAALPLGQVFAADAVVAVQVVSAADGGVAEAAQARGLTADAAAAAERRVLADQRAALDRRGAGVSGLAAAGGLAAGGQIDVAPERIAAAR